jgi:hypothetical protein
LSHSAASSPTSKCSCSGSPMLCHMQGGACCASAEVNSRQQL